MLVEYERTYHAKDVSGSAKHVQKSTEDIVFGFCEADSHILKVSTQSKFAQLAMKTQLAASEAEERKEASMTNVRR